jgi:hypothetical protein
MGIVAVGTTGLGIITTGGTIGLPTIGIGTVGLPVTGTGTMGLGMVGLTVVAVAPVGTGCNLKYRAWSVSKRSLVNSDRSYVVNGVGGKFVASRMPRSMINNFRPVSDNPV